MPHWAGWIVVAIICGIAEMLTPSFFIAWFGVGALAAAILSLVRLGLAWQVVAFVTVSTVLVLSTKRLTSPWLREGRQHRTNIYALEGTQAVVTQDILEKGSGQVRVGGEIWTATSETGSTIPAGVPVTVVRVDGVRLVVRPPE